MYHVLSMNSNTYFSKKTSQPTTLTEQSSNSTHILNDVENTEFIEKEKAWLEQLEIRHLAYADIDLHY